MDEENIEPSGPPPVRSSKLGSPGRQGTPIPIKGAYKPTVDPKRSIPITEQDEQQVQQVSEQPPQVAPISIPLSAADKDLQAIDMGDDIDQPNGHSDAPQGNISKQSKRGGGKKFITVLIILVILSIIVAGVMWFLNKPKAKKAEPVSNTNAATQTNTPTIPSSQPTTPSTKIYKNAAIKVELTYPSTWKTTETATKVVFSSPEVTYTKKDATQTKGSFRLIVQKGFNQTDSTTINNAVAVKTSELIKYTAPATGQRTESYLSYLGTDKTTFTFILITSGKQYKPGDTVAATLPLTQDSYIVAGGYGKGKGGNIDFDALAIDKIDQSTDVYNQAVEIIKSLKITP